MTIKNLAVDFPQQLHPAQKNFCKNGIWENHSDLGSAGKDVLLPYLNLSSGTSIFKPVLNYGGGRECLVTCWPEFLLWISKTRIWHL